MCIDIHIEEIAASFDIFHIHTTEVFYHALAKVIPVFVCIQCPARFGDGYCTWESLIVAVVIAGHVFRPDVTLYTDDMLFHQFVCIVLYMVVAVSLFKRNIIGWDEILEGGLAPNATVMSWRGVEGGLNAAKDGHNAIMTPNPYAYLDQYQEEPEIAPVTIGG